MASTAADEQILRGSAATITATFRDQNGDPTEPAGVVTVGVVDAAGVEVVPSGSATTSGGTGVRQRTLTAAQTAQLGLLTATWTDAGDASTHTTTVEVAGGFYASVGQIRSSDLALADVERYPTARLLAARRTVETEFEAICGVAFVPRYRRVTLTGSGTSSLALPDPMLRVVRSARIYSDATTYTTLTADELAEIRPSDAGTAARQSGVWPCGTVVVEYEHGFDRPPADVLDVFWVRLRDVLNRSNRGVPDRTATFSPETGGTFSLIVPGQRGSVTGIPDVDVVLSRYSMHVPGIA